MMRRMKLAVPLIVFILALGACGCPTGSYTDSDGNQWSLTTPTGGAVTGTVTTLGCGRFSVTGSSDGVNITLNALTSNPVCCTSVDFVATANGDCSQLVGSYSYPEGSSCSGKPGADLTWDKVVVPPPGS